MVAHLDFNRHIKFDGMAKYEGANQFNELDQAIRDYKKSVAAIRLAAEQVPEMRTLVGFEVDFYRGADWWQDFNVIKDNIDFLIGSTHSISNSNGTRCRSMYFMNDFSDEAIKNYFQNVQACIASKAFNFIAHIDLIRKFVPTYLSKFTDIMDETIKMLVEYKMLTEINTSGLTPKSKNAFPEQSILVKLATNNVPMFISDDAHSIQRVGANFDIASNMLKNAGIVKCTVQDILNIRTR